jgi:predicted nucleotidyltransferase
MIYVILLFIFLNGYNINREGNGKNMKTAAIICEYNPFHNGHKYHIEKTKTDFGATHLIGVMSGNFVQRGDVAVYDKFTRAKQALENGIDLVLELPVTYSLSSAEQFAAGAVKILNSLNCVNLLSFGSECGDIELLNETAGAVAYLSETEEFHGLMRRGLSYPAALSKVIEKNYEDIITETLTSPNNTLAVEYINALADTGSAIEPVTVKRHGAEHDSEEAAKNSASASLLRKMIINNDDVSGYTPCTFPADSAILSRLETAILYKLRSMSSDEISKVPNVLHGLENRIVKVVKAARTLPELMVLIKTKRYTLARLRRIILCCLLGITKNDAKRPPQYIRILGMNEKGREILAASNSDLPVNASLSTLMKHSDACKRQGLLEIRCTDIYALAFKKALPCSLELTSKPIIYQ